MAMAGLVILAYNGIGMFRLITLILPVLLGFSIPGYAQSSVTVRTGKHGDYTRTVFDWPASVPYQVMQPGPGELVVNFDSQSSLTVGATESGGTVSSVEQISGSGEDLSVRLKITEGSTFRHFLVGSRVVVDVFSPSGATPPAKAPPQQAQQAQQKQEPQQQAQQQPAPQPQPQPAPAAQQPPVKITSEAGPKVKAVKPEPVEAETVATPAPQEQPKIILDSHVITITSTETMGLAAFIRGDYLWLVMDRSTVNVEPQVAGNQAEKFSRFYRFELKGGVAYRVKLPPGGTNSYFYGEGGGLVWRIVMTPKGRYTEPLEMQRNYSEDAANTVRGATVSWPMQMASRILDVPDPAVGDILKVVTVAQADEFVGGQEHLADLSVLRNIIGLAVQPKVDDLTLAVTEAGMTASRPEGLAISPARDLSRAQIRQDVKEAKIIDKPPEPGKEIRRIFDFDRWMMGGINALEENQRILLSDMAPKDINGKVQDLLTLAKMNVSNDRGQEAVGFLNFAADEMPGITDSPEYKALYGASAALAGKYELAFEHLFHPTLMGYSELDYWRAYTLAWLEDWQQAMDMVPDDYSVLISYPRPLLEKLGVKLAEVELRAGDADTTKAVIGVLEKERESLRPWTVAAMDYLKGEAHRQKDEVEEAKKLWEPLTKGQDDLYRAKAILALTNLQLEKGEITSDQAIDRLEGLRYSWRGDELEAQVNFNLGKLYLEKDNYMKGFTILRDTAGMSPDSDIGKEIVAFMRSEFLDILVNDKDITPIDAAEVYEGFRELTPAGPEGDLLIQKLAERLAQADLLNRAAALLEHQVDKQLQGTEKGRVAVRLGAIHLLDNNARQAMKYLAVGRDAYAAALTGDERAAKLKEIDLLRARGLSQLNRTEEAIAMLNAFDPSPDVNRLRADIAWKAGLWEDAAEALNDLVLDEALDPNRPLTPEQAVLILNQAVALNLSGNRVALNTLRLRHEDGMKKTAQARLFDIVTRPRKSAIMADKETIESIVKEVDLFQDFLKSYQNDTGSVSN